MTPNPQEPTTPRPYYNGLSISYQGYAESGPEDGKFMTYSSLTVLMPSNSKGQQGRYDFEPISEDTGLNSEDLSAYSAAPIVKGVWKWVNYYIPWGCEHISMCRAANNEGTVCAAHVEAYKASRKNHPASAPTAAKPTTLNPLTVLKFFTKNNQPSDVSSSESSEEEPTISKFCSIANPPLLEHTELPWPV